MQPLSPTKRLERRETNLPFLPSDVTPPRNSNVRFQAFGGADLVKLFESPQLHTVGAYRRRCGHRRSFGELSLQLPNALSEPQLGVRALSLTVTIGV